MPEEVTMARPKKGTKKVERLPDERVAIIHLKGTVAYAQWLEEFFQKTHIAKATLVRLALKQLAKEYKHRPPPDL
jgi:ATP-dependent protease HslVU (ClpYQ) peptidase subunit